MQDYINQSFNELSTITDCTIHTELVMLVRATK